MRSGKRALAGVAAGALGAASLAFFAATPSQAAAIDAASLSLSSTSATVIIDSLSNDDSIAIPYTLVDTDGEEATAGDTVNSPGQLRLAVTAPSGATNDDSVTVSLTGSSFSATSSVGNNYSGYVFIKPAANWSTLTGQTGTYGIDLVLYNTATGSATSSSSLSLKVYTSAASPAAGITFVNGINLASANIISGSAQIQDDSVATTYMMVTDAAGGPLYTRANQGDDTLAVASTNADTSVGAGWGTVSSASDGTGFLTNAYSIAGTGVRWKSKSSANLVATYTAASGAENTATLPVELASVENPATLTNGSIVPTSAATMYAAKKYYVKSGTTSVDLAIATDDTTGTIAWNATSTAGLTGVTSPSGAATAVTNGNGTATLTVSAAAASDDETVTIYAPNGSGSLQNTAMLYLYFVDAVASVTGDTNLAKVGDAATVSGVVTDQWGDPLAGSWNVSVLKSGSCYSSGATYWVTGAVSSAGAFSVEVPAAASPTSAQKKTFTVCSSNGLSTTSGSAYVEYTADGKATSLTWAVSNGAGDGTESDLTVLSAPKTSTVDLTDYTATSEAKADIDQDVINSGNTATVQSMTITSDPGTLSVTVTAPEGIYLYSGSLSSIAVANGKQSITVDSGDTVKVYGTKPGLHAISASAGGLTADWNLWIGVKSDASRVLTPTVASKDQATNSFAPVTATATDIFGNPVPEATARPSKSGSGTIAPAADDTVTADEFGVLEILYTSTDAVGTARVTWTFGAGEFVDCTCSGYPALVKTGYTDITVKKDVPPTEKTIVIVGTRGTVKGKPGIMVDGVTTGFAEGDAVVPHIKFPGQTSYSEGTARPKIDEMGDFYWQRKTGKKIYIYFSNEGDTVKSERIIIQAK